MAHRGDALERLNGVIEGLNVGRKGLNADGCLGAQTGTNRDIPVAFRPERAEETGTLRHGQPVPPLLGSWVPIGRNQDVLVVQGMLPVSVSSPRPGPVSIRPGWCRETAPRWTPSSGSGATSNDEPSSKSKNCVASSARRRA